MTIQVATVCEIDRAIAFLAHCQSFFSFYLYRILTAMSERLRSTIITGETVPALIIRGLSPDIARSGHDLRIRRELLRDGVDVVANLRVRLGMSESFRLCFTIWR